MYTCVLSGTFDVRHFFLEMLVIVVWTNIYLSIITFFDELVPVAWPADRLVISDMVSDNDSTHRNRLNALIDNAIHDSMI